MAITPYTVAIDHYILDDLRDRLRGTRWPDAVASGWDYGADLDYLRELVAYWVDDFDWMAQQKAINELDQFRADVDGIGLHFVHERAQVADSASMSMPLLLLHGWPATFLQMRKILPCSPIRPPT